MNKIFKNLIFLLILSLFESANCAVLEDFELSGIIYSTIQNETKEALKNYSDDFKITVNGILKENIQTKDDFIPKVEIVSQNKTFSPNSYKRVLIKDANNNIIKSFGVNVQTFVYKDVLVADKNIPYGTEINSENTKIERREIGRYLNKTLDEITFECSAKRNYPKGSIILSDGVKKKVTIARDSSVEIIFISQNGIKITLQGHALKEGYLGDIITVRSDKYKRIYNAQINSPRDVIVRI